MDYMYATTGKAAMQRVAYKAKTGSVQAPAYTFSFTAFGQFRNLK
jgi:hypothetical protein